jgi:hypothetical protein
MAFATLGDEIELLLPPPPRDAVGDVAAAARDACRFPLSGPPLEAIVQRGARVTIVLDSAALPLPPPFPDPRQAAVTAVLDELVALGVPASRVTAVVASGLARRPGPRELDARLGPQLARRLGGAVGAPDVESPELVPVGEHEGDALLADPRLVEADAVVVVSPAETVQHGGPAALLAAAGAATVRAGFAGTSLLESTGPAWQAALAVERALAQRVPLFGVSLSLAHPAWGGLLHGFPYGRLRVSRIGRSRLVRAFALLPGPVRRKALADLRPRQGVDAVLAGLPSVAHTEALLRGLELRGRALAEPLAGLVLGMPPLTPQPPLERQNPLSVAYLALGHALRLWRGRFPVADGGTLVVPHRLHRRFAHPTQAPYRAFFAALRAADGREPGDLAEAERSAAVDAGAVAAYREGRTCHPRLPFAEWEACAPARARLGAVLVAGCRDAAAARALGFVPVRSVAAALDMAAAASPGARLGCLAPPPFLPLAVAEGAPDV